MRKHRVISGIAYPHLIAGDNPTRFVRANLEDRNDYYHDEAIRLSEADIERFSKMVGKPICIEHDRNRVVGDIFRAWKDSDGKMRIMARIFLENEDGSDFPDGVWADQQLRSGNLQGLSVGYGADVRGGLVHGKEMHEISLCRVPFFEGSGVTIAASKDETYKQKSAPGSVDQLVILLSAMNNEQVEQSSETVSPPASSPAPTPPSSAEPASLGDKDAGEVSKQAAAIFEEAQREKKRNEELLKKQKEMEETIAAYKAAEKQRQLEYAQQNKPAVDDTIATMSEIIKEAHGEEAQLPEEFKHLVEDVGYVEENAPLFKSIVASATLHKKYKASLAEKEKLLEEMRKQNAMLKKDQQVGLAALAQGKRAVLGLEDEQSATTSQVSVAASNTPGQEMSQSSSVSKYVVPKPSAVEKFLLSREQGLHSFNGPVQINASGAIEETEITRTRTYVPAPSHGQMKHVRYSARHKFPELFSHLAQGNYTQVPTQLQQSYTPDIFAKKDN